MNVLGYPVIGQVQTPAGFFPLVNIPMMTDDHWNELAREQVVKNYIRENGKEPDSVEIAFAWQREWVRSMEL